MGPFRNRGGELFLMMDIQAFHGSYAIDNRYHSHTLE